MDKDSNNQISSLYMFFIMVGNVIGIGVLSLASSQTKICFQDGWLSTILGGIYPLSIVLVQLYIIKKYSKDNILTLTDKFFGSFIGKIANLVLGVYFFTLSMFTISGLVNVLKIYSNETIRSLKLAGLILLIIVWLSNKKLKVLGKINLIGFILTCLFFIVVIPGTFKGLVMNLLPMFQVKTADLLKGATETAFSYAGIEVLILFHPYIKNKDKITKNSILAVLMIVLVYTITVVIGIIYFGSETVVKGMWPLIDMSRSLETPVVNNFRFVFISMNIFMSLRCTLNNYYSSMFIFRHIFNTSKNTYINACLYPISLYLIMQLTDEVFRRKIINYVLLYLLIPVIIIILSVAIITSIKKKG